MNIELVQQLKQQQILAPQMILSMDILLLTHQELATRIEKEFMENPALEISEPQADDPVEGSPPAAAVAPDAAAPDASRSVIEEIARLENFRHFDPLAEFRRRPSGGEDFDKQEALQNLEGHPPGLRECLVEQLQLLDLAADVREAAEFLVNELDDRGYLLHPAASLRQELRESGMPEAVFDQALATLRSLDPAGVGAENLEDCLRLQLLRDGQDYPVELAILERHLDDLRQNKIPKIAKDLGKTVEEIKDALEILAMLDPYPGRDFDTAPRHYIQPDVVVEEESGDFKVTVHDQDIPSLQVSDTCKSLLSQHRKDREIASFLRKKIDSAQWLIQAVKQRRQTIRDIAACIVKYQIEFMRHGPSCLRAMKMQTIADLVGVHISTISRAIKGKYMQTPVGLFEMKYFFTGGVERADGEVESRRIVYQHIAELIKNEDKRRPLSDTAIARMLRSKGLDIARRTVTKYRDQEKIPPSRLRKAY
jgi:RNA polymerase sigma-54 factor